MAPGGAAPAPGGVGVRAIGGARHELIVPAFAPCVVIDEEREAEAIERIEPAIPLDVFAGPLSGLMEVERELGA
jgi:hypothetical protein